MIGMSAFDTSLFAPLVEVQGLPKQLETFVSRKEKLQSLIKETHII